MSLQRGIVNNHPIVESSLNPGVPVSDTDGDGNKDIVAANAAVIALAGLTFTAATVPTANDDAVGSAGNGRFGVPSFWTNTASSGSMYVCTDNTVSGANWVALSTSVVPGGNVENIESLTQTEYDLLNPPDTGTLYIIVG